MTRREEMLVELQIERKIRLSRIAQERVKLRDVEHRLKVFFAWEGDQ